MCLCVCFFLKTHLQLVLHYIAMKYTLPTAYFQQDGATSHTTKQTIEYLQEFSDNKLMCRDISQFTITEHWSLALFTPYKYCASQALRLKPRETPLFIHRRQSNDTHSIYVAFIRKRSSTEHELTRSLCIFRGWVPIRGVFAVVENCFPGLSKFSRGFDVEKGLLHGYEVMNHKIRLDKR